MKKMMVTVAMMVVGFAAVATSVAPEEGLFSGRARSVGC